MKNNPQWWDFTTPNDEIWFYNSPLDISPDFTNKTTSCPLHLHRPCIQASSFGSISCSSSQPLQEILGFEKRPAIHVDYFNGYLDISYLSCKLCTYISCIHLCIYVWIVDTLKWSKNAMSETTHLQHDLESWITHLKHFVKKITLAQGGEIGNHSETWTSFSSGFCSNSTPRVYQIGTPR